MSELVPTPSDAGWSFTAMFWAAAAAVALFVFNFWRWFIRAD